MNHAAEGSLLAYLDEALDGPARARLTEHLAACRVCTEELAAMRQLSTRTHELLARIDVPAPVLRARAALATERRMPRRSRWAQLGAAGFARAAMLLLALAGAGAAAIPGSPVRRALEATFSRVAQLFTAPPAQSPAPAEIAPAPAPAGGETASIFVAPAGGTIRIALHEPAGRVEVVVRLAEQQRAGVVTTMEEGVVRFVSGAGRIEVTGLGTGRVEIEVPRSVRNANILVGEETHVVKDGDDLRLTGPAGSGQGTEVRFRIGS